MNWLTHLAREVLWLTCGSVVIDQFVTLPQTYTHSLMALFFTVVPVAVWHDLAVTPSAHADTE